MMDEYPGRKSGFTLVELSIVMVIIGLLIGGILVGQNMIDTARRQEFLKELHAMKFAYENFKESMHSKPGDFPRRMAVLGGVSDGDGDGLIEWNANEAWVFWDDLKRSTWPSITNDFYISGGAYLVRSDVFQNYTRQEFYYAYSGDMQNTFGDLSFGTEDAVTMANTNPATGSWPDRTAIKAKILVAVDSKIDDGFPWAGMIRGHHGVQKGSNLIATPVTVCSQASGGTQVYKLHEDGPNCRMLYLINRN